MKIYKCDNCGKEEKARETGVAIPFWGTPNNWLYGYIRYDKPSLSFITSLKTEWHVCSLICKEKYLTRKEYDYV